MARVTLADIAREVGCSTATVSYVLNNDPRQKINEKTRMRIIQVSSILGYQKNAFASGLADGKSHSIGLYVGRCGFPLETADKMAFVYQLVKALALNGYRTVLFTDSISMEIQFVDAILCIDFDESDFDAGCKSNFIPVLGVDTHVHEPWTFEISSDFAGIGERFFLKDYVLLCHERNSKRLREEIREANPNVHFVSSFAQLDMLEEALQGKKVIVEGESMYDYLKNKNANFIKYVVDCEKKINKIVTCLKLAIEHAEVENHVFKMS